MVLLGSPSRSLYAMAEVGRVCVDGVETVQTVVCVPIHGVPSLASRMARTRLPLSSRCDPARWRKVRSQGPSPSSRDSRPACRPTGAMAVAVQGQHHVGAGALRVAVVVLPALRGPACRRQEQQAVLARAHPQAAVGLRQRGAHFGVLAAAARQRQRPLRAAACAGRAKQAVVAADPQATGGFRADGEDAQIVAAAQSGRTQGLGVILELVALAVVAFQASPPGPSHSWLSASSQTANRLLAVVWVALRGEVGDVLQRRAIRPRGGHTREVPPTQSRPDRSSNSVITSSSGGPGMSRRWRSHSAWPSRGSTIAKPLATHGQPQPAGGVLDRSCTG